MSLLGTILLIVLFLALIGVLPSWPHEGLGYGWGPSGGIGLILVIVLVLVLRGHL